jgi:hypothetical protein
MRCVDGEESNRFERKTHMLPEIKVPEHLIALKQAQIKTFSDDAYIRSLHSVYSDTAERRVEWDLKVAIAAGRCEKAMCEYDVALKKYLKKVMP